MGYAPGKPAAPVVSPEARVALQHRQELLRKRTQIRENDMNKIPSKAQNLIASATMSAQGHIGSPILDDSDKSVIGRVKKDLAAAATKGDPTIAYIQAHHRLDELQAHIDGVRKASKSVPAADRREFVQRIEILEHARTTVQLVRDALKSHAPDDIPAEKPEKVEAAVEKKEPEAVKPEKTTKKKADDATEKETPEGDSDAEEGEAKDE